MSVIDTLNRPSGPDVSTTLQCNETFESSADKRTAKAILRSDSALTYQPMPLDHLPRVMRDYVVSASSAIGCDPSYVVLPLLAVCAGAIGNTRRLCLKPRWHVPPILWTAVIGDSGTQKSPPLKAVSQPLKSRQQRQAEAYSHAMAEYNAELTAYRKRLRIPESADEACSTGEPAKPTFERCYVSDTTIEGLIPILQDNWRGLTLLRDELVGWIGAFDKYSKSSSASTDAAHWLSIYNADTIILDRKTGDPKTLVVPDAAVSICGTIQPGILNRVLGNEHRENGLAARILMAYPPRREKRWTEKVISESEAAMFENLVSDLFDLIPHTNSEGRKESRIVGLSESAKAAYEYFYNATAQEQAALSGDLAAAWSKLEETAARLALVFHCVRQVTGGDVQPLECDQQSMAAGIAFAEWFKGETHRIHLLMAESPQDQKNRTLAEWICGRGGRIRTRDLVTNRRDTSTADQADRMLQALVEAKYGEWQSIPAGKQGGPPTREFVLYEQFVSAQPYECRE